MKIQLVGIALGLRGSIEPAVNLVLMLIRLKALLITFGALGCERLSVFHWLAFCDQPLAALYLLLQKPQVNLFVNVLWPFLLPLLVVALLFRWIA